MERGAIGAGFEQAAELGGDDGYVRDVVVCDGVLEGFAGFRDRDDAAVEQAAGDDAETADVVEGEREEPRGS